MGARRKRTPTPPATSVGVVLARFLVVHSAAEIWVWAALGKFGSQAGIWSDLLGLWPPIDPRPGFVVALAFSAVAVLAFRPGQARLAAGLQAALKAATILYFFPNVPNHFYAFGMGLALCAFCDPERESDLLVKGLAGLAALIFFDAGIQKILHASYFQGSVLAFMIAQASHFDLAFRYVLPAEEVARLRAAAPLGPFRLESWLGLVVANLTWVLEIGLPAALLVPRLRVAAALAATALLFGIQFAAREVFFAGFMVPLLLLWVSPSVAARSVPIVYVFDAYLVLAGFGLFPYFGAI